MLRAEREQVDVVKSRLQLRLGELESERAALRSQVDDQSKKLEKAEREARGDTEEVEGPVCSTTTYRYRTLRLRVVRCLIL